MRARCPMRTAHHAWAVSCKHNIPSHERQQVVGEAKPVGMLRFRFGCLQCTSWCTHTMAWARRTALDQHGNSFGFCNQICRLHGLVSFEIVQARIPQLDGMRSEFQAIHGFTDRSWNAPVRSAVPGLSLHHDGDGNSDTFCNQSLTDLNSNPLPCQHGPNRPRGFWLYNSAAGPSVSFYYKFALRTRWS